MTNDPKQGNTSCPKNSCIGAEGRGQQRANNQSDSGRRTGDYETETQEARIAEVAEPTHRSGNPTLQELVGKSFQIKQSF